MHLLFNINIHHQHKVKYYGKCAFLYIFGDILRGLKGIKNFLQINENSQYSGIAYIGFIAKT